MKRFRPLQGEALLYMESPATFSDGGIVLRESTPENNDPGSVAYGEVRRLGIWELDRRGRMIPHPVKPGDRVALHSGSGRWLRGGDERMKVVKAADILAVVEK